MSLFTFPWERRRYKSGKQGVRERESVLQAL